MSIRRMILAVVAALVVAAVGTWLFRQVEIDSCLDAGGRFDYQQNECETE